MAGPSQLWSLMIVLDADFIRMAALPSKRDAVLVVHADAVPPGLVSLQGLQPIPGRHQQIIEPSGGVQQLQLPVGDAPQVARDAPGRPRVPVTEQK
jgi:hypothetical protein